MPPKTPLALPRLALGLLIAAAVLESCAFFRLARSSKIKNPTFAYASHRFIGASDRQADMQVTLSSFNPNAIGLKNVTVDYELFYEGNRFLNGADIALELKPMDTTRIVIPASVVYREILAVAGPAAQGLLRNRKSIPVRIDAVLSGNPTLYNEVEEGSLFQFSLKVSRTVDVPIPEDAEGQAKKAVRGALKKFF
jgi:hypothetical protein